LKAEGEAGGLLIIVDGLTKQELAAGRALTGKAGQFIRKQLSKSWNGPVVFDCAVRCSHGVSGVKENNCRGYLAQTMAEVQPKKVLLFGSGSHRSVLDRAPAPFSVRHGYAWTHESWGDIPVYLFPNPMVALHNRFVRRWLEDDIEWALTTEPPCPPAWGAQFIVVETRDDALVACDALRRSSYVVFDTETAGEMWRRFQVVCLGILGKGTDTVWMWDTAALGDPVVAVPLFDLLHDHAVRKVGQNLKYDELAVRRGLGVPVRGVLGDTRLLRKIMDTEAAADLATMAELVGMGGHKGEAALALDEATLGVRALGKANAKRAKGPVLFDDDEKGRAGNLRDDIAAQVTPDSSALNYAYGLLPDDILLRYCARDVMSTALLYGLLDGRMERQVVGLRDTYRHLVMPATQAIRAVECWGVPVDVGVIKAYHEYLTLRLYELREWLAGYGLKSPGSDVDTSHFLFQVLHLPPGKQTATGAQSVDKEVLGGLRGQHPVVDDLLLWRKLSKQDSNYAAGMLPFVSDDGRVHPSFLLDGARSGRLSCQSPNLQTIPKSTDEDWGRMARGCFAAQPGWSILSVDYSQLELRIAAMLSGDPTMTDIFKRGEDLHQKTAEMIAPLVWKITAEQVKRHPHRDAAKTVNFGVLYGQTAKGLALKIGCSEEEAERIIKAILGKFSKLSSWIQGQLNAARTYGVTWTYWDGQPARVRNLWQIGDEDKEARGTAERSSWNTPIQGTGSDYLLRSLVQVVDWLKGDGVPARLVLPVHDSLLLEVRDDCLAEVAGKVVSIMQSWPSGDVPLLVEAEAGPSWGDLKKIIV
jgi:DNA polymerase I-like protein with 3'-5' exonuclease and polymerase domains